MHHFIKYVLINSQHYNQRKKLVSWLSERENPYSENMNQTDLYQLTCTCKLLCCTHKADGILAKHQHSLRPPPHKHNHHVCHSGLSPFIGTVTSFKCIYVENTSSLFQTNWQCHIIGSKQHCMFSEQCHQL
jgi:hypothetical protein